MSEMVLTIEEFLDRYINKNGEDNQYFIVPVGGTDRKEKVTIVGYRELSEKIGNGKTIVSCNDDNLMEIIQGTNCFEELSELIPEESNALKELTNSDMYYTGDISINGKEFKLMKCDDSFKAKHKCFKRNEDIKASDVYKFSLESVEVKIAKEIKETVEKLKKLGSTDTVVQISTPTVTSMAESLYYKVLSEEYLVKNILAGHEKYYKGTPSKNSIAVVTLASSVLGGIIVKDIQSDNLELLNEIIIVIYDIKPGTDDGILYSTIQKNVYGDYIAIDKESLSKFEKVK